MRSLLFVPGNMPKMLHKASDFKPDAYVPDLEDSVPDGEKDNARRITLEYLPALSGLGIPVVPRVNAIESGWLEDDLAAVVGPLIYGVTLGKV